jgi:hypothetical protein
MTSCCHTPPANRDEDVFFDPFCWAATTFVGDLKHLPVRYTVR